MAAIAAAPCAEKLTKLAFENCNFNSAPMITLSGLLGQDRLPSLRSVASGDLEDHGVAAFAQGLLAAPRTRLSHVDLSGVRMGDESMAALASVVRAGRFDRLETIDVSYHDAVTKGSVCWRGP